MDSIVLRPGFRVPFTLVPSPEGAKLENPAIEVLSGSSTASIEATEAGASGYLNGDGGLGLNEAKIVFDGRLGPDVVLVEIPVAWSVTHPDATGASLTFGETEPIPA